jgi:mandelamide amidase
MDELRFREAAAALSASGEKNSRLLCGTTIGVKDNIDVAGLPTTTGTPALQNCVPARSATVVNRLEQHGALIAGKTNMHELAFGVTSKNAAFGFVHNPLDTSRSAGGSSGGSTAAVAAGLVHAALGTDTAGSVRIPAAFCGCVGFRPSTGRYPDDGLIPLMRSRDSVGIIASSVNDVKLIDRCIGDGGVDDTESIGPPARLGLATDFRGRDISDAVERQLAASLDRIRRSGIEIIDIAIPGLYRRVDSLATLITAFEVRRDVFREVVVRRPDLGLDDFLESIASDDVARAMRSILSADPPDDSEYQHAIRMALPALRGQLEDCLDAAEVDAIIFPTTPTAAFGLDCEETLHFRGQDWPLTLTTLRNMQTAPLAGLPSITLPMPCADSELPGGLTLEGRRGEDARLLAVAGAIERLLQPRVDIDI